LRLERGRDHHDRAPDERAGEQRVARRDRLRRLAESHVVGQEQPSRVQEPADAFALIRKQFLLETTQQPIELAVRQHLAAPQLLSFASEQRQQRGLGEPRIPRARGEQHLHRLTSTLRVRRPRAVDRHARGRALKHARDRARYPDRRIEPDTLEPVSGARQRPHRIPAQRAR
jgi:hypothetical protein